MTYVIAAFVFVAGVLVGRWSTVAQREQLLRERNEHAVNAETWRQIAEGVAGESGADLAKRQRKMVRRAPN